MTKKKGKKKAAVVCPVVHVSVDEPAEGYTEFECENVVKSSVRNQSLLC